MISRVLIAEDDRAIRESVTRALQMEGYDVSAVGDGPSALMAANSSVDLLVLDVMMPGLDGLTVCKTLRTNGCTVPIVILTARTESSDRVSGLDAGADDYLSKPFELAELLARMRALLRRASTAEPPSNPVDVFTVADLRLESATRRVWRAGHEVLLSRTEFDLLELLVRNCDVVLSHATIYDRIWGYDFGPESKNLTVYVSYLRRKIDSCSTVKLIHTIRGVGYAVRAS